MTKIERVQAFRAPDGQLYATREECRAAVIEAVVTDLVASTCVEFDAQGVTDFVCRNLDLINASVDRAMGSV